MSQTSTLKGQCIAEFLGTGLIFFGVGCVAALKVAGATFGRWEISIWGLGGSDGYLPDGRFWRTPEPGSDHRTWLFACFDKRKVVPFIISQVAGARAAALVTGFITNLLWTSNKPTALIVRGSVEVSISQAFSQLTRILISIFVQAFTVEMVITAILMGLILALTDGGNGVPRGPLAPLLIGLIAVIGASMGPLTGFCDESGA